MTTFNGECEMFVCAFEHLVKSIIRRLEWFTYSVMSEEDMCGS